MKMLTLALLILSSQLVHAKIYNSFMCYTQVNIAVMFGVLKENAYIDIHYSKLDQNPTRISMKVKKYKKEQYYKCK